MDAVLSMMREMQTKVELVYDRWARLKALQQADGACAMLSEGSFARVRK
jgi:hypothetical protein